jgi:hypothetical protein
LDCFIGRLCWAWYHSLSVYLRGNFRRVIAKGHWAGKIDDGVVLLILGVAGGIALFFHGFRLNRRRAVWSRHLSDRGRQTVDGIPLWQSKMLRCTERFILPEERVYILGTAQGGNQEESANEVRVFIGSHPDGVFHHF